MEKVAHYRMTEQELRGQVEALQAQVAAMSRNVTETRQMATALQSELSTVTEQLAASTEARLLMAGTIRDLRTENEHLRAAVARLVGLRPLELPDREPWGDGYAVGYTVETGVTQ